MYRELVNTKDKALVHLFFHCCLKDGDFGEAELQTVSDMIVSAHLNQTLNLTDEMNNYRRYKSSIVDETNYLSFLMEVINPANRLALFSFCAELFLSDKNVTLSEEVLINKIAGLLYIKPPQSLTVQQLIMELNAVQSGQTF
ncbi:MAG: TerB family tellurite resistance protein [Bacteroidota bacterium]